MRRHMPGNCYFFAFLHYIVMRTARHTYGDVQLQVQCLKIQHMISQSAVISLLFISFAKVYNCLHLYYGRFLVKSHTYIV
jgi:hypothetical protein